MIGDLIADALVEGVRSVLPPAWRRRIALVASAALTVGIGAGLVTGAFELTLVTGGVALLGIVTFAAFLWF